MSQDRIGQVIGQGKGRFVGGRNQGDIGTHYLTNGAGQVGVVGTSKQQSVDPGFHNRGQ